MFHLFQINLFVVHLTRLFIQLTFKVLYLLEVGDIYPIEVQDKKARYQRAFL
jgi:hypothetical protein